MRPWSHRSHLWLHPCSIFNGYGTQITYTANKCINKTCDGMYKQKLFLHYPPWTNPRLLKNISWIRMTRNCVHTEHMSHIFFLVTFYSIISPPPNMYFLFFDPFLSFFAFIRIESWKTLLTLFGSTRTYNIAHASATFLICRL